MKNFIIYTSNGQIKRVGTCQEEVFSKMTMEGELILEGSADTTTDYIENSIVKKLPEKPDGDYLFNYTEKKWLFDYDTADIKARYKRSILLSEGPDRINPIWWSSMTSEQQQAWTDYRQALLDVTGQADYPQVIIWPTKPE